MRGNNNEDHPDISYFKEKPGLFLVIQKIGDREEEEPPEDAQGEQEKRDVHLGSFIVQVDEDSQRQSDDRTEE